MRWGSSEAFVKRVHGVIIINQAKIQNNTRSQVNHSKASRVAVRSILQLVLSFLVIVEASRAFYPVHLPSLPSLKHYMCWAFKPGLTSS